MKNELYQHALEQLSTWVVTDSKGYITEVNENFCRVTQYTAFELLGKHLKLLQVEPQPEQFINDLTGAIATGSIWRGETKYMAKDGSSRWSDTTVATVKDASNQLIGFLKSCQDITAKKEAEFKIIQQVQKTNYMIEHRADAYISVDAAWKVTKCNNKMLEFMGMSLEESMGRYFLDIFIAGTNDYNKCEDLKQALAEQKPTSFDVYCPGRAIWFEVNVYPDGEGLALTFRNITDHKLMSEKIKQSEQQLRAILQSTVSAFFFLGLDMRIISFNERARTSVKHIFNRDLQEGDDIRTYSFEPDSRVVTESFHKALEGEPLEIERKVRVNGKMQWYWMTYSPVFDEDRQTIGVVLNAANINNLKLFESETLRMNERFLLAAKATNDAIYDWNMELDEFKRYEAFYDMFGYQTHDVESSLNWWADRIHAEEKELIVNSLNQVILEKHTNWNTEYRFQCQDGSFKFVYDRGYIVYSEAGVPIRMIGALQDIHQIKENERKIKQQNEQLREIAYSQSHEVRRPVANILGLLKCLNKDDFGPENQQVLHYLEQTTMELDVLIRKIVDKTYHT